VYLITLWLSCNKTFVTKGGEKMEILSIMENSSATGLSSTSCDGDICDCGDDCYDCVEDD